MTTLEKSEFRLAGLVFLMVLSVLLFDALAPAKASGQTTTPATTSLEKTEVDFATGINRLYLGVQGGVYHPDMVQWGELTVTTKRGTKFGVWGVTDFTTQKNNGKELDLVFGQSFIRGPVTIDFDVQYFLLVGGDALNTNLEVGIGMLFLRGEGYMPAGWLDKSPAIKEGWAVAGGLAKDFSRGPFGFSFLESLRYDSGAFGYEPAWVHRGEMAISLDMNSKTEFKTGVVLSQPITTVRDRKREVVWEIGISRKLR